MSVQSTRHEDLAGVVPGLPGAADLADVWLGHALACLLDGCEVPEDDRAALVESGCDELEAEDTPPDETRQLRRLDACRSALALSALAVEARLNRVLRRCHAAEWSALLRLSPAERFRLAPRLLDELEWAARDAELSDLVEQVFAAHDELVDAAGSVGAAFPPTRSRFGPDRARDTVEASAELCCFLADLTGEDEGAAPAVREAARALRSRAWRLSGAAPRRTEQELGLNGFGDFPPDVIGS